MTGEGTTGSKWFWWTMGIVAAVVSAAIITALHLNSSSVGTTPPAQATAPPAQPTTATDPAGTAPAADPLTVVRTYFGDLSAPQDLAAAWSLLSPAEQNSLGGYAQWSASRSNIADETVTYLSGSGDQVTVALHQVRYNAPATDATATFTVDGGVITAVG